MFIRSAVKNGPGHLSSDFKLDPLIYIVLRIMFTSVISVYANKYFIDSTLYLFIYSITLLLQ